MTCGSLVWGSLSVPIFPWRDGVFSPNPKGHLLRWVQGRVAIAGRKKTTRLAFALIILILYFHVGYFLVGTHFVLINLERHNLLSQFDLFGLLLCQRQHLLLLLIHQGHTRRRLFGTRSCRKTLRLVVVLTFSCCLSFVFSTICFATSSGYGTPATRLNKQLRYAKYTSGRVPWGNVTRFVPGCSG